MASVPSLWLRVAGVVAALAQAGSPRMAAAADVVVVGDSIGVGIAAAAGLKKVARNSISLRRGNIPAEIARTPAGAVVILSVGTNDALDPLRAVTPAIDHAIDQIAKTKRDVVWVGPPCAFGKWAQGTAAIDGYLRERLTATAIRYVSLRDDWICNSANRASDGVHFRHSGYVYLWEKVRREAPVLSNPAPATRAVQCSTPTKATGSAILVAGQICSAKP